MKLPAYTIIEGIITMVILSILLSATVMISFNVYKSFPPATELWLQNQVDMKLDSLVRLKSTRLLLWEDAHVQYNYEISKFESFDNVYRATLDGADSLGEEYNQSTIFYIVEDED